MENLVLRSFKPRTHLKQDFMYILSVHKNIIEKSFSQEKCCRLKTLWSALTWLMSTFLMVWSEVLKPNLLIAQMALLICCIIHITFIRVNDKNLLCSTQNLKKEISYKDCLKYFLSHAGIFMSPFSNFNLNGENQS